MEYIYFYAFGSIIIVSLISLIGVFALSLKEKVLNAFLFILVSVAAGALFGDAIIHLIPEIFTETKNMLFTSLSILSGVLGFFILEKFLRWRHVHEIEDCCMDEVHDETRIAPIGYIVWTSDSIHNFIDGLIIGISYLVSIEIGIATTIAIILHEIPQEISDFAILLHAGFKKQKALLINFLSALFALLGGIVAVIASSYVQNFIPIITGFAAGSFLYIAGSDLVPEIHKTKDPRRSLIQFIALSTGIAIMAMLVFVE